MRRGDELLGALERELRVLDEARGELDAVIRSSEALLHETVGLAMTDARERAHLLSRTAEVAYRDRPWRSMLMIEERIDELVQEFETEIRELRREWQLAEE